MVPGNIYATWRDKRPQPWPDGRGRAPCPECTLNFAEAMQQVDPSSEKLVWLRLLLFASLSRVKTQITFDVLFMEQCSSTLSEHH